MAARLPSQGCSVRVQSLQIRDECRALAQGAAANGMDLQTFAEGGGINRETPFGAERLRGGCPAFLYFDVNFQFVRENYEDAFGGRHDGAKRLSRQVMAVGPVADHEFLGVDLRLKGDVAAVASSNDLHCLVFFMGKCRYSRLRAAPPWCGISAG